MTTVENITAAIDKLKEQFEAGATAYALYGIRFDDRELNEGYVFGKSKSNIDREDEREFPEYGTEEYNSLSELGGTSVYYIFDGDTGSAALGLSEILDMVDADIFHENWYLVGANDCTDEAEDANELVMINPKVICKL